METYSGSNAVITWDENGVELSHGAMSAKAVGAKVTRTPWSKVLGASVEGGMVKYVRLDVDGHEAPPSPASDRFAVATRRRGDAERLVAAFNALASCVERIEPPVLEGHIIEPGPQLQPMAGPFRPWMRRAFSAEIFAWNVTLVLMVGVPLVLIVVFVIWALFD